jgi:PqqD family protein of HPr-rel-A system
VRRWTFNALTALHWQHFEGEWVIFDEGSGQTFVLDVVIAAALMAVESGCRSDAEITQQVLADVPLGDASGLAERLAQGLEFLAQLGLLEEECA